MREIKFRGLDDEGMWHYGAVASIVSTSGESYGIEPFLYCLIIELEYQDKIELWRYPVNPETVGQYIGLKDKNLKEIYEGDIISKKQDPWCEEVSVGIVKYNEGSFYIEDDSEYYDWGYDTELEIIGNVYENKDLLNEKD